MKNFIIFLLIFTLITSCSIEKRRYTGGYHINFKNNKKNIEKTNQKTRFTSENTVHNNNINDDKYDMPQKVSSFDKLIQVNEKKKENYKKEKEYKANKPLIKSRIERINSHRIWNKTSHIYDVKDNKGTKVSVLGVLLIYISIILAFTGVGFLLFISFWNNLGVLINVLLFIGGLVWVFGCYILFSFAKSI